MEPEEVIRGNGVPLKLECLQGSFDAADNTGWFSADCNLCGYWVETLNEDPEELWNLVVVEDKGPHEDWLPCDHTVEEGLDKKSVIAAAEKYAAEHTEETCLAAQQENYKAKQAELDKLSGELSILTITDHYECEMDIQTGGTLKTEYDIEGTLLANSLVGFFIEAGIGAKSMSVQADCVHTRLSYLSEWETADGKPGTYDSYWHPKESLPNPCKHEHETYEKHWTAAKTGQPHMSIICGDCNKAVVIGVPTEL